MPPRQCRVLLGTMTSCHLDPTLVAPAMNITISAAASTQASPTRLSTAARPFDLLAPALHVPHIDTEQGPQASVHDAALCRSIMHCATWHAVFGSTTCPTQNERAILRNA